MIDDNVRCPHCGKIISVTDRTNYVDNSSSSYQGTGSVTHPRDTIILKKPDVYYYHSGNSGD